MKKIQYIAPAIEVSFVAHEMPIATSNQANSAGVTLNPNTMDAGDGSDAVKRQDYNVWNDDWSK